MVTAGHVPLAYLNELLGHLRMAESLAGLSVLDIGAADGFFSFEAERRGAAPVVAYDLHPPDRSGFASAKRLLGSNVEYIQGSVYDLSAEVVGTFDVVFFLGVLEHLRYPLLALDRMRKVTKQYALIETYHLDRRVLLPDGTLCALAALDPRLTDVALYQFYRTDELASGHLGPSGFGLNKRALEDGLWSAGFQPHFLAAWADRIAFRAVCPPSPPEHREHVDQGRAGRRTEKGWPTDIALGESRASASAAEPSGFESAWSKIREPKKKQAISYSEGAEDRIVRRLRALDFVVREYQVDVVDYRGYMEAARYLEVFPDYYAFNRPEKSLEHYLAARLLALQAEDVYIDVASEHSPAPDIYRRLFGLKAYRQDLAYPGGLLDDMIGGDAASMPVPPGFATKMALHCSFEHFEGDSDLAFVREAGRVLRFGGSLCIVPLYLFEDYVIQTDPEVAAPAGVVFEGDATVYGAQGWGNRHGRFYDPEHLHARVRRHAEGMSLEIFWITNTEQIDPSCYVRFALLLSKVPSSPGLVVSGA